MSSHKYWIALDQAKGIGPANLKMIYDKLNSLSLTVSDLFSLTESEIKAEFAFHDNIVAAIGTAKVSMRRIEEDYHALLDANIDCILFFEDAYPKRLHDVLKTATPPVLYTYGNKKILNEKGAAILGESGLSERGEHIAFLSAKELAAHKIVTISGMAKGIEIVHRAALVYEGRTAVILPCGIFHFKISDMLKDVFRDDNAVIISPFYPAVEPNKYNAYIRNRLICALSYAAFFVECSAGSGIFEAVKSAKKLEIPLFVTEYKDYPVSASANKSLIEEGAHPVKGRLVNNELTPNLDELIGTVKFR